jgi:DNA-directed RNA polymerase specialized sigma24 family protein
LPFGTGCGDAPPPRGRYAGSSAPHLQRSLPDIQSFCSPGKWEGLPIGYTDVDRLDGVVFAQFYQDAKDDCLRVVLASVGNRQTAEDLVAEAFTRAWASWHKVSKHPAPRAWVVRTALNAHVSRWQRRRREVALADADGAITDAACSGLGDPPDGQLMAAVLRLPLRQRQVIALRLFLDLDTAQTAQMLGIAPGTVTAHMARAIAALRAQFSLFDHKESPL